jgi:7,8-dihydropterin-6-yl-methyl-4-(beta-D-ribofuranosyl)aminobenzene 5'-phosphate synthase
MSARAPPFRVLRDLLVGCALFANVAFAADATDSVEVTILYDGFGKPSAMEKDWGYSALVAYGDKRILFDTGNNPETLAKNAKAKGVDLSRLDFAILSHRHGDHMGGLSHLLEVNPKLKIYAPKEGFGVYGSSLPSKFYRRDETLPREQRYYDGSPPEVMEFGSAWPRAQFELIESSTEIAPGIHLVSLVSDKPGTLEMRELSLAIETTQGVVLIVGCSHPGIERIVETATKIDKRISGVIGGFHLVTANDADIQKVVTSLKDVWNVGFVAPGHCTGEPTFSALKKAFGVRYLYAGLGSTLTTGAGPSVAYVRSKLEAGEYRDQH